MKVLFILALLIGCIAFFSCASNETQNEAAQNTTLQDSDSQLEKEAIVVAQKWLTLIDNEKYEESWGESAKIFQNAITKENWASTVKNVRSKAGKFQTREVASSTYTTTLPGVPDGDYVIIQFNAKFENNENAGTVKTGTKEHQLSKQYSSHI